MTDIKPTNGFHPNGTAKHAGGRPTKYKSEYCQGIIDFFTVQTYRQVLTKETIKASGEIVREYMERGGDLKFLSQYARNIGVTHDCMLKWCNVHPEFLLAYNAAKDLQKEHLIQNGVQGNFNPAFTIFTAKNITEMKDQPTTIIDNSKHVYHTKVELNGKPVDDLIHLATGRIK